MDPIVFEGQLRSRFPPGSVQKSRSLVHRALAPFPVASPWGFEWRDRQAQPVVPWLGPPVGGARVLSPPGVGHWCLEWTGPAGQPVMSEASRGRGAPQTGGRCTWQWFRGAGPIPVSMKHQRPARQSRRPCSRPKPWIGGASVLSPRAWWTAGPLTQPLGPLQSHVHRLDVAPREEADPPREPAPPPAGVKALQDLNDVTTTEAELGGILGREVKLGLGETGPGRLQGRRRSVGFQEPPAGLSPWKPQEEAELGLNPALCPGSDDSHPPTPPRHGPSAARSLHICSTDPTSPQGLSWQPSWDHMASNQGTKSWASAWDFGQIPVRLGGSLLSF